MDIIHLDETTSTNSYLKELLSHQPLNNFASVYADFQSAGRGQQGNTWISNKGENLIFSTILFPTRLEANRQFIISQIVSLSIKDILSEETDNISIKWPNDIYWTNKKIVGILIENNLMDSHISQSVIGAGINLNQTETPESLPNFVSLKQITGKTYDIKDTLEKVIARFRYYYELSLSKDGIETIRIQYKKSLFRKDGFYQYADNTEIFRAKIIDVEDCGLLVLETENKDIRKFSFKEVRYIL